MNSRLNRRSLRIAVAATLALAAFSGCSDDDNGSGPPPAQEISLELDGFPVSTPEEGTYELWISFAGTQRHDTAQSMGKFRVNADGQIVKPDGTPNPFAGQDQVWQLAVDSFITIEPAEDSDPGPSLPGIVGGEILNRHATLDIAGDDAIGFSYDSAAGSLVLATPSTSDATDETEGIWFTSASGTTGALTLPSLPMDGPWIYEAWTSNDVYGVASLGRFYVVNGPDDDGSGPLEGTGGRIDQLGYSFPGSDFPFDGLRLSLTPGEAFITIEPANYSDGLGPFILTVLQAQWGVSNSGTPIAMTNLSSSLPTASLTLPE
ncbi:MAG TPA: hypothetical protein VFR10_13460 [bacterium]|nr:hypothetical protein [bacterium]